jgi:hypothetical protein
MASVDQWEAPIHSTALSRFLNCVTGIGVDRLAV